MDIIWRRKIIHNYLNCRGHKRISMDIQKFFEYLFHYIRQQSRGISVKEMLLMWVICAVVLHIICMLYAGFSGKKIAVHKEVILVLILGYACFGGQITLFRRVAGSRGTIYTSVYFGNLLGNWYERQQFYYSFLNICFFVPWGFLWGIWRWDDYVWKRLFMVTGYSFLSTAMIEITQFITGRGFFEVLDIITNVMGGIIGCMLASICIPVMNYVRDKLIERGRKL